MANLFTLPFQTAVDATGRPYAGLKAYFYQAGTLIPQSVFQESSLTTLHANPVEADDAGRLPPIWLNPSADADYRVQLKTRFDTLLENGDIDNLPRNPITAAQIGVVFYPRTATELAASITPTDYTYRPGHVKRYGSTLDSATLQTALTANAGNAAYLAAGETHVITDEVTVPINTDLRVDGEGTAILDGSAGVATLLTCAGTLGATLGGGPTGALTARAYSLTLNSAPALTAGDLCILRDPADSSFNAGNTAWRSGEFLIVKDVTGAVVTFTTALIASYPSTAELLKVTPTSTQIIGKIEIRGNPTSTANDEAVFFNYGRANVVEGVYFKNTTGTCLEFNTCYQPTARNCQTGKYVDDSGSIQSTGILMASCQYGHIYDCDLYAARHAASTGGGGIVTDRFNLIEHCHLGSKHGAAADFHGNAQFCSYRNNHIDGLITLSGVDNSLVENKVYSGPVGTTLIQLINAIGLGFTVERNHFYLSAAGNVLEGNDTQDVSADTTRNGTLVFRSNRIYDSYAGDASYIVIANRGSTAEIRFDVSDNIVRKDNTGFFGNLLSISVTTGSAFDSLNVERNTLINAGFGIVSGVMNPIVKDNDIKMPSLNCDIGSFTCTTSGLMHVGNNTVNGYKGRLLLAGTSTSTLTFDNNTIIGGSTTIRPVTINTFKNANLSGNKIGSEANTAQTRPIDFFTVANLAIQGDIYRGVGPPVFDATVTGLRPSAFSFEMIVPLTTPATSFALWTIPAGMTVMPILTQGRADTDITATDTNSWGVGVDATNRRTDYGVCSTVATSSKHAKNAKFQRLTNPVNSAQLSAADVLSLISVDAATDGAGLGSNMGGASQAVTLRMAVTMVGNLPDAP